MNILFFLTPKEEVAYIFDDDTLRQAIEKMEHHKYSCVPILKTNGDYVGSISEGDLLWGLKYLGTLSLREAEDIPITTIKRRIDYSPVHIESDMEDLIEKAMSQNYVPVVDDQNKFIGIITRKDIIQYCYRKIREGEQDVCSAR